MAGHIEVVKLYLSQPGADVNVTEEVRCLQICHVILPKPQFLWYQDGLTALMVATKPAMMQYLLTLPGIDINRKQANVGFIYANSTLYLVSDFVWCCILDRTDGLYCTGLLLTIIWI